MLIIHANSYSEKVASLQFKLMYYLEVLTANLVLQKKESAMLLVLWLMRFLFANSRNWAFTAKSWMEIKLDRYVRKKFHKIPIEKKCNKFQSFIKVSNLISKNLDRLIQIPYPFQNITPPSNRISKIGLSIKNSIRFSFWKVTELSSFAGFILWSFTEMLSNSGMV